MLQFMYTGNYDLDKETDESCAEACNVHSALCLMAKKYNIKFLPELAECRLKQRVLRSI